MTRAANNPMSARWLAVLAMACAVPCVLAQTPATAAPANPAAVTAAPDAKTGVTLDYIVAIVNQDVILESDVEEEMRFSAFQPFRSQTTGTPRERAQERLINRMLILQQEKLQPQAPIPDSEVQKQIHELRQTIPACLTYKCETDAGWERFLADNEFTEQELEARWRQRMQVLAFIEIRFRSGIQITRQQITEYYQKQMLPEYARQKATPPPMDALSARIE
ncbi:MAG TPA: peptidylprolyl isomerase, partial [Acidobacteriaceae bacterium]